MRVAVKVLGALTAKPHAFFTRPWEVTSYSLVDVQDSLCTVFRFDFFKAMEPLRVLPYSFSTSRHLGGWISDRTRFAYDGLRNQRLFVPLIRIGGTLRPVSWFLAFREVLELFGSFSFAMVAGPFVGPGTLLRQDKIASAFGLRPTRSRGDIFFHFPPLEAVDMVFMVGCNLRLRLPLVHLRLRRLFISGGTTVASWGGGRSQFGINLGHRASSLMRFMQGRHKLAALYLRATSVAVFVGGEVLLADCVAFALQTILQSSIFEVFYTSADLLAASTGFSRVQQAATGFGEAVSLWLLGAEHVDWDPKIPAVVYQGHHGDRSADRSDVVLPSCLPIEESEWRVDPWGQLYSPVRIPPLIRKLPSQEELLRAVAVALGNKFNENSSLKVSPELLGGESPFITFFEQFKFWGGPHYGQLSNYYRMDAISRASLNMAIASRRLASFSNYVLKKCCFSFIVS